MGNTSLIDCSVNGDYYAEKGFFPIIAGVDQACFENANFSAVNMGPYYSSLGGAQAALRAGAKGTMVIVTPNQPGFDIINSGVTDFAEANGLKGVSLKEDVPIADPAGLAQKLVQTAGDGRWRGARLHRPDRRPAAPGNRAAGLVDKVIWASSTPPNDPTVAEAARACLEREVPDQR